MSQYEDTQQLRNAQYRQQYEAWVAKLTPRQRRDLARQGLLQPQVDSFHVGKRNDVADLPIAAAPVLPDDSEDEPGAPAGTDGEVSAKEKDSEAAWAALRRLIAELIADPNPVLGLDCLTLVSGIGFLGESMTDIARRHKVTRAAVSKRCVRWTTLLGLMPSRAMRSLTARQAYRHAQKAQRINHERFNSRRLPAPGSGH